MIGDFNIHMVDADFGLACTSKNLSHSHYKTVAIRLKIVAIQKIATLMDRKKTVAIASWLEKTVAIRGY